MVGVWTGVGMLLYLLGFGLALLLCRHAEREETQQPVVIVRERMVVTVLGVIVWVLGFVLTIMGVIVLDATLCTRCHRLCSHSRCVTLPAGHMDAFGWTQPVFVCVPG